MPGVTDLAELLRSMEPIHVPGEFVFVSADHAPAGVTVHALVREPEGTSIVLERADAERLGLDHDFSAGWITLQVHSALEAVGLTAAVSAALTAHGISCNVIAGRFHDHLLVPTNRVEDALGALRSLSAAEREAHSEPPEFEGNLAGAVFWGADLRGARFRDVDLTDAEISHALLVGVDVDAVVDRVVINGVDVTAHVNAGDPWYPLRTMLRPIDPEGLRSGWAALETEWAETIADALARPGEQLHESVDGEFSFVQTLRHLVFAIDKWFTVAVLGDSFDPLGLPNTGSLDYPFPGLDLQAEPTVAEVLSVRTDRTNRLREYVTSVTAEDFERSIDVIENGPHPLLECLYTVLEEEFWHLRYARRDLARLPIG
jgi:hypothetical protein